MKVHIKENERLNMRIVSIRKDVWGGFIPNPDRSKKLTWRVMDVTQTKTHVHLLEKRQR